MASYYGDAPALSREEVARYLYDAGVRGDDLWKLVAIGGRESGYRPAAHRTDSARARLSGDRGLFQINSVWDSQLQAAGIITQKSDLFNPAVNAKAAAYVLQHQGYKAWGMGSGGWSAGGNPMHGTNQAEAQAAVNRFMADPSKYQASGSSGGSSGMASSGPVELPPDAVLIRSPAGATQALFNLGQGVWIRFAVDSGSANLTGKHVNQYDQGTFNSWMGLAVDGGKVQELADIGATYGSFGAFWNSIVGQTIGWSNPAAKDQGVLKVLAQFAGRPDMSEAELQNMLKGTNWWRTRTEAELRWNSLSPAEQDAQKRDLASRMNSTWFQFTGEQKGVDYWLRYAHTGTIASGKMSFSEWTEKHVKAHALKSPESPWSREVRTEQENQRQRGIDTENTKAKIRETVRQWGLEWNESKLNTWAKNIVEKKSSDDDLLNAVKGESNTKYAAWKRDPNVSVADAAAPWLDTYNRVMEDSGTVFTPEVNRALQNGQTVADFEVELKKSQKWLGTKNARNEMFSIAGEMGQMLGFV